MTDVSQLDQLFLGRLREIVEANLANEQFDVEKLTREARMSRSAVHRHLRNLGKINASHFITEIRLTKARAMLHEGNWTAAEVAYPEHNFEELNSELETAIDLNPSYAAARQAYAQVLMITGPIELACKHVDVAVKLEPYFWVVHNLSTWIYYFEEEYEKGIEACIAARDLNPDFIDNNWLFVLHYTKHGEGEKAAMALRDAFVKYPSLSPMGDELMIAYYKSGVEGIFEWLIDVNKNRPIPLDGLTGNPCHYFNLITTNPDFDILRGDPRFTTILEKSGLAAYNSRTPR